MKKKNADIFQKTKISSSDNQVSQTLCYLQILETFFLLLGG